MSRVGVLLLVLGLGPGIAAAQRPTNGERGDLKTVRLRPLQRAVEEARQDLELRLDLLVAVRSQALGIDPRSSPPPARVTKAALALAPPEAAAEWGGRPLLDTDWSYAAKVRSYERVAQNYERQRWESDPRVDDDPVVKIHLDSYQEARTRYLRLVGERRRVSETKVATYQSLLRPGAPLTDQAPPYMVSLKAQSTSGVPFYEAKWRLDLSQKDLEPLSRLGAYLDALRALEGQLSAEQNSLQADLERRRAYYRAMVGPRPREFDRALRLTVWSLFVLATAEDGDLSGAPGYDLSRLAAAARTLLGHDPGDIGPMASDALLAAVWGELASGPSRGRLSHIWATGEVGLNRSSSLHSDYRQGKLRGIDLVRVREGLVRPQLGQALSAKLEAVLMDPLVFSPPLLGRVLRLAGPSKAKESTFAPSFARYLKKEDWTVSLGPKGRAVAEAQRRLMSADEERQRIYQGVLNLMQRAFLSRAVAYRTVLKEAITEVIGEFATEILPAVSRTVRDKERVLTVVRNDALPPGKYVLQLNFSRPVVLGSVGIGHLDIKVRPDRVDTGFTLPLYLAEADIMSGVDTPPRVVVEARGAAGADVRLDARPETPALPSASDGRWKGYEAGADQSHRLKYQARKFRCRAGRGRVVSTFIRSTDGWRLSGDGTNLKAHPGYISGTDRDEGRPWYFSAPSKYLGDQSEAYGHIVSFELKQIKNGHTYFVNPILGLSNGKTELWYKPPTIVPAQDWTKFRVCLHPTEANWMVYAAETKRPLRKATRSDFRRVLRNLQSVRIGAEHSPRRDVGGLRRVRWTFGGGGRRPRAN